MRKSYESQRIINQHIMTANSTISIIGSGVRAAGYVGCAHLSEQFKVEPFSVYSLTVDNYLVINGADLFSRYQQFPGSTLIEDMDDDSRIVTDTSTEFRYGQILLISDCRHAEIFRVANVINADGVQQLVAEQPLRHLYQRYAEVGELVANHYFISRSEEGDSFSLFREDIYGEIVEAVEGVHQLEFTRDHDGVKYEFVTSAAGSFHSWQAYVAGGKVGV